MGSMGWGAGVISGWLVLVMSSGAVAAETGKRAFGIEDYYRVRDTSGLDLSPDGSAIVYTVGSRDLSRGRSNRDLYRIDVEGRNTVRLTWTEDSSESNPIYSPDGKTIAFVARRGEQKHEQIWLLPADGGESRPLTDLRTGISDPVWSPTGKLIAFTGQVYPDCGIDMDCHAGRDARIEEGPLEAHVADDLLYRHWNAWSQDKVSHILVVDVATGIARDLTPGDREAPVFSAGGSGGYAFSPDGKELCFTRNPDPMESLAWSTNSDLWVVPVAPDADARTGTARNITADNPAWDGSPVYSPDGRYIAFLRQALPGYESDLYRLALYDRNEARLRIVAQEFDNRIGELHWMPDGTGLVFSAHFEGSTPLYHAPLDGGAARKLAQFAYIDAFRVAKDGRAAYAVRRSVGQPREIWRLDLDGDAPPQRLTTHNLEFENEVDIRPAESIWVDGADGRRIQVFLVKPHGFDPGRRYPLILNVHGGPQGMWADSFRGDWQVYPGAGYVVAFPNPHGSTGHGQQLTDRIAKDWGGKVFEDLMKITDALERLPYVDPERIGAMGWSYGGYMMNWFQGHTDRFKCLADMMGIFDLRSFYYTTEELWFPEWDLGGPPWSSSLYDTWNPAAFVDEFRTPMLIVTGEMDFRVPYTQGLMSFTALRRRGVPARLVVLPRAGHWPGWYEMALYYTAHLDWFHRYLGGDPPPWSVEDFARNAVFASETGERIDGPGPGTENP